MGLKKGVGRKEALSIFVFQDEGLREGEGRRHKGSSDSFMGAVDKVWQP